VTKKLVTFFVIVLLVLVWEALASYIFLRWGGILDAFPGYVERYTAWWSYFWHDFSPKGRYVQKKISNMLMISAASASPAALIPLVIAALAIRQRQKGAKNKRPLYGETEWVKKEEAVRRGFSYSRRV
jgi:type IV secretory pathway TraG/TraD family ATPase VirD4